MRHLTGPKFGVGSLQEIKCRPPLMPDIGDTRPEQERERGGPTGVFAREFPRAFHRFSHIVRGFNQIPDGPTAFW